MITLFKIILFFLIVYYLLGVVARLAMPYVLRYLVVKTSEKAAQNAAQYRTTQQQDDFVQADSPNPKSQKSEKLHNKQYKGGDYIEYEEN
jgi:hypothetical protein